MKNTIRGIISRFNHSKLIVLILVTLTGFCAKGQQAIPAAGGNTSSLDGSVSFSIGQVAFTTTKSSDGRVSEGVQQTYEISVVRGLVEANNFSLTSLVFELEQAKNFAIESSVYPNPVIDYLTLRVDEKFLLKLSCELYTLDGKLIETKVIQALKTVFFMGNLPPEIYFLKVYQNQPASTPNHSPQRILKTFKIIKN
jgi:hypothetical protein